MTIQHGAELLWRTQEGAHGNKQTGACSAAEWCITPGQDVLDSLGLLLYCRELLGTVLDSVAEQSSLGDESIEKVHFVDIASLRKAEQ